MSEPRPITPVILSGGSGTRLWPLSRSQRPKQLLGLTHPETMLQLTVRRAQGPGYAPPVIVANAAHADLIEAQLAETAVASGLLILEPDARNTAPAIALAAFAASDPDDLLLVMPSDHVIENEIGFRAAVEAARGVVEGGWLATFGMTPDKPETGYGYIRIGAALDAGVYRAEKFVEKPSREVAETYLAERRYAWNGGIFLFRAGSYVDALERHAPQIAEAVRASVVAGRRVGDRLYPEADAFRRSPSDSVDYAVMEKAERVAVVPVEIGWSDVGSWDALHEIAPKDSDGNVHRGEVVAIDTSGCLIRTDGPLVAAVGVKDLIIVATGDAVLVLPRGSSQDVKRAIEQLKRDGHVTLDRAVV
ncbi:MAG: mannose-1-phosphate guanylyltransferase/mannose-6-phosphate isomerase [Sphingomonadaceae bacterium]|nr:mannose-1-phosphate guanylyltransferase/mannose-6-phosphate isomerase [Sphingomonadaceae bacterium]